MTTRVLLLPASPSEAGDLFGRGMRDVAHALGYEEVILNIPKSGREVDIQAKHRVERRRFVAECKAHQAPRGGADINKFAGVLQAEQLTWKQKDATCSVEGYFLSLSGFTGSAIEQETQLGGRLHLLGPAEIVQQLTAGRIVVPVEEAMLSAGTLAGDMKVVEAALGLHDIGWLWIIHVLDADQRPRLVVVHADGTLATSELVASLNGLETFFPGASPLNKVAALPVDLVSETEALERYLTHLNDEYGSITLEGLPTDDDVSARKLRLESLFVPVHVVPLTATTAGRDELQPDDGTVEPLVNLTDEEAAGDLDVGQPDTDVDDAYDTDPADEHSLDPGNVEKFDWEDQENLITIGEMLEASRHSALLAMPGGGKSTLIKRLAVAYTRPERLTDADDDLPDRDWLPVVIRCRQLGALVTEPIQVILDDVPVRAEMIEAAEAFRASLHRKLLNGQVLLLIDGLDEISDPGLRIAFVSQLRTFIARYPTTQLVVTSRESGFRAVAGAIADLCVRYRIADLSDEDIASLTIAWHREIVGNKAEILAEAAELAKRIVETDRVKRLARNPLLLTTLLLVKRWVGDLPRKRSVLYGKAIEVLLATWNVEGHEPLDQDEVLPQLAFVAHRMMVTGRQTIPVGLLTEWLTDAREAMPDILGYARTSVTSLVERVEERSSLLSISGHEEYEGRLQPTYEFKHLTFQEYLTALALASGWFDKATEGHGAGDALAAHYQEPAWKEVVPLTAVLSGRHGARILTTLIPLAQAEVDDVSEPIHRPRQAYENLVTCLVDEVPVSPELLRSALAVLGRGTTSMNDPFTQLRGTRFAEELVPALTQELERLEGWAFSPGGHLFQLLVATRGQQPSSTLIAWLGSDEPEDRRAALLYMMEVLFRATSFDLSSRRRQGSGLLQAPDEDHSAELLRALVAFDPRDDVDRFLRAWALSWGLAMYDLRRDVKCNLLTELVELWFTTDKRGLLVASSWAIWSLAPETGLVGRRLSVDEEALMQRRKAEEGVRSDDIRRAAYAVDVIFEASPVNDLRTQLAEASSLLATENSMTRLAAFLDGQDANVALSWRGKRKGEPLVMLD